MTDDERYERLSRYLDGELSPEERARVEERMATDPVMAAALEELRGTIALLEGDGGAVAPPPLDWSRVDGAGVALPVAANAPWSAGRWVAAAVAVAALGLFVLAPWSGGGEPTILTHGVVVVDAPAQLLAGDLRIDVDGRAAIAVEPVGPDVRGTPRDPLEGPMDKRTILAGLAGAVVTVTVYEGTAFVARAGEPLVAVAPGRAVQFDSNGHRPAPPRDAPASLPAPGPARDAALEARVEELKAELKDIAGELEAERFGAALMRGQLQAEQGELSEWPDDVAEALTEAAMSEQLVPELAGLDGFSVEEMDCYEYPCVVALRYDGDDDTLEWGRPVSDAVEGWAEARLDNVSISMNQSIFRTDGEPDARFVLFAVDDGQSDPAVGDRAKWRMEQLSERLGDDASSGPD